MSKPKAYTVGCDDDDHGQKVVFACRGKDVSKSTNGDNCDCHLLERRVRRAPEFDKYAPGPVTTKQYLAEGWRFECGGCGEGVYSDESPIVVNDHVYCSRKCIEAELDRHDRWAKDDRIHESLKKHVAALRRWIKRKSAAKEGGEG